LDQHFPGSALDSLPWPTGRFEPGRLANHYQVLDAFGARWIVLSLEFGPRDAAVAWADDVLRRCADVPAILLTSVYLYSYVTRYCGSSRSLPVSSRRRSRVIRRTSTPRRPIPTMPSL